MEELEVIVQRMIDAGEPEENIKMVIEEYEKVDGLEKPNAVEDTATATAETEEADTDLALEDGSLESPEKAKDLGFFESVYNSLSNLTEQLYDIPEFYGLYSGDEKGANASLEIAAKSMADAVFGSASVQKFTEDTGYDFLTQGLSEEDLFENIRQRKIEQDKTLPTLEVIKSIKEGDAAGVAAGIFNAAANGLGSVAYGVATLGVGFFSDYAADNYINYNKLKAENLGVSMDELIKSGEADNGIPLTMAAVSTGLEALSLGFIGKTVGGIIKGTAGKGSASLFAQMNKSLAEKVFYNKNARTSMAILNSGLTEFSTEILQHASDKVNEEFGSVAGTDKQAEVATTVWDAAFSEEGLEAGIQGFFGATSIGGAAVSAKAMSSIRNIVDGESTTENIDKLVKLNNQKQAATDNTVKKGLQVKIDKLEQDISDSVDKGNEIYDSLSDGQIQEIEDLTELADAASYNITELNKKFRRGDISQEEYNAALSGFNEEYNSARQTLVDMRLSENIEFAKKEGEKLGLDVQVKETEEEYLKALRPLAKKMNLEKWSKMSKEEKGKYDSFKDFENAQLRSEASFVGQGKIFINKEGARKGGAINVGAHEILHPILNKLIGDASKQLGIVRSFKKSMTWDQKRKVEDELTKRGYKSRSERATEYLTVFSDLLSKKKINYDKSALEKLSDAIIGTLKKAGVNNVSLESGKDAYEFMAEYQESIEKGEFTEEMRGALGKDLDLSKVDAINTQQKSAEVDKIEAQIDKLDEQLNDGSIDVDFFQEKTEELFKQLEEARSRPERETKDEPRTTKETKDKPKQRVSDNQKGLNKKVDDLVGEKNEDGDYVMTKDEWDDGGLVDAYEAIISGTIIDALIRRGVVGEPSYLKQFTNDVKDGLTETLMRFNPEKNNSLIGFINGQLRFRKGDVLKSYKANLTASLDVESGEIGAVTGIAADEEFDVEEAELSEAKENAKKIKASERFIENYKLRAKLKRRIAEDIINVPPEKRTFKKAPFLAADIMGEEIGVPAKKIVDKTANLSSAELRAGAMYIFKHADLIATLLPKGYVDGPVSLELQGTGSNIPGNVLRAYYNKDTSRVRTGPGLSPYIKKRNLTGKDILAGIGFENGKLKSNVSPKLPEGQTIKGLLNVITRLVENEYSRRFGDLTEQQAANYRGGLQDIQFSLGLTMDSDHDLLLKIQFSRKDELRKEYENVLRKKRPNLIDIPKQVDELFKWADGLKVKDNQKSKYKKLALYYTANGYTKFPEDGYKIKEVVRLSEKNKIDPYAYKNPDELIVKYTKFEKAKQINPDGVKEFTNKQKLENGVVIYDVEDSKAGQQAVRGIVDGEWGINANPWCLIARTRTKSARKEFKNKDDAKSYIRKVTAKGYRVSEIFSVDQMDIDDGLFKEGSKFSINVAEPFVYDSETELYSAGNMWKMYNLGRQGYKIAFQGGKLISFRDGGEMVEEEVEERTDEGFERGPEVLTNWWDRFDEDTTTLKISLGVDKDKNSKTFGLKILGGVNTSNNTTRITGYEKNSKQIQDGLYELYDSNKRLVEKVRYEDNKIVKKIEVEYTGLSNSETTTKTYKYDKTDKDGRFKATSVNVRSKIAVYKSAPKQTLKEQQETARTGTFPSAGKKSYKIKNKTTNTTYEYIANQPFGDNDARITTTIVEERITSKYPYSSKVQIKGDLDFTTKKVYLDTYVGTGEHALRNEKQMYQESSYTPKDGKGFDLAREEEIKYKMNKLDAQLESGYIDIDTFTEQIDPLFRELDDYVYAAGTFVKPNTVVTVDEMKALNAFKASSIQLSKSVDKAAEANNSMLPKLFRLTKPFTNADVLKQMGYLDFFESIDNVAERMYKAGESDETIGVILDKKHAMADDNNKKLHSRLNKRDKPRTKRLAPNGERSNLNDQQYDIVRTPAFKKWFGDWEFDPDNASKVLDENGEPRVVWRARDKTKGDTGYIINALLTREGVFFTDKKSNAVLWAEMFYKKRKGEYEILQAFLNIRNPDVFDNFWIDFVKHGRNNLRNKWRPTSGKDGAIILDDEWHNYYTLKTDWKDFEGKQFVAVNSKQIKLADGSNTTFGVEEDNIQFSKAADELNAAFAIKLDSDFNKMVEAKTGIAAGKEYAKVRGEIAGKGKGFFRSIIKPSAEDFVGLLYAMLGKGKEGNEQMAWLKENLLDPYARGIRAATTARSTLMQGYKELVKEMKNAPKGSELRKKIPLAKPIEVNGKTVKYSDFTVEQAIRVYIWRYQNYKARKDEKNKAKDIVIPGLSESDIREMQDFMKINPALQMFAKHVMSLTKGDGYPKPSKTWSTGNIVTDLLQGLNTTTRAKYLAEWQANSDIIFSEKNLNKLEAVFGKNYRTAMEDILTRMRTGRNRNVSNKNEKLTHDIMDWINGSVGVIMFLNTKSAFLQALSMFNFINWSDNNVLAAGKAFANKEQYFKDFIALFNSEFLLERRNNLRLTVNDEELAEAAKQDGVKGVINVILQKGFLPTQFMDSFAIASGGATFYRNRINSLIKQGMPEEAAEKQAFNDFRELSEESQQSSRPDKISQQQSGILGRLILAFANTPAQYARLIKKAVLDIKNGRGDLKTNISKILYYGVIQNLIFNALQSAIFFFAFGDDDEEENKKRDLKYIDLANGMLDSLLRGVGVYGAAISVAKNALIKVYKESDKPLPDYTKAVDEILKISPPIASKFLRLNQAANSIRYDADEMSSKGFSPDNPAYLAGANVVSALTNVPLDRLLRKLDNVGDAIDSDITTGRRVMLLAGWSKWQLGIQDKEDTFVRGRRTTGSKERSSRLKALEKRRR